MACCGLTLACAHAPTAVPSAAAAPWWRSAVCYEVFVRSFQDSDGDGIGDLRGLASRLDYINDGNASTTRDLGANCIWLMPVAKSPSYHGYDVTDYYHVEPDYGTDADFKQLMVEAHKRGIRVLVDFVPNHSSSEHPYFQAALRDTTSPYRAWYRWSSVKRSQIGPWGQETWHKSPVRDEYYYGIFWGGMPDLNYDTPAVRREMEKVAAYWVRDMGADGLRLDAVPYLVEQGDSLAHTSGTHEVLRELAASLRLTTSGAFTVGEVSETSAPIVARYYPDQLNDYFAFGVAEATIAAARTGNAARFQATVTEANALYPPGRWSPFLTNHDHVRVMTQLGGNVSQARVAATAMLMLPGMPFVYYGEEIGVRGDKPDEQIRTPMQWSAAPGAGFTHGKPWEDPQPDWRTVNVAAQDSDSSSLLSLYRQLIHLRLSHPALSSGDLTVLPANDTSVAAFMRRSETETAVIVVNFGSGRAGRVEVLLDRSLCATYTCRLEPLFGQARAEIEYRAAAGATWVTVHDLEARQGVVMRLVRQ
jgi:alpha-amylase